MGVSASLNTRSSIGMVSCYLPKLIADPFVYRPLPPCYTACGGKGKHVSGTRVRRRANAQPTASPPHAPPSKGGPMASMPQVRLPAKPSTSRKRPARELAFHERRVHCARLHLPRAGRHACHRRPAPALRPLALAAPLCGRESRTSSHGPTSTSCCITCSLHPYPGEHVDAARWDAACDIVVERTIAELDLPVTRTARGARQQATLARIDAALPLATAETVYRLLGEEGFAGEELAELRAPFYVDDHEPWYRMMAAEGGAAAPRRAARKSRMTAPPRRPHRGPPRTGTDADLPRRRERQEEPRVAPRHGPRRHRAEAGARERQTLRGRAVRRHGEPRPLARAVEERRARDGRAAGRLREALGRQRREPRHEPARRHAREAGLPRVPAQVRPLR